MVSFIRGDQTIRGLDNIRQNGIKGPCTTYIILRLTQNKRGLRKILEIKALDALI